MKIASWNVNSLRARLPHIQKWLATAEPDVLGLQETKLSDDLFPAPDVAAWGYHSSCTGQTGYNGVALLSREPPAQVTTVLPGIDQPEGRFMAATFGSLRVVNVYVPNGQTVGSDQYSYKLYWLGRLAEYLKDELHEHQYLAVMGDFNIAPEERDVDVPKLWENQIMFSGPEREAFHALLRLGLVDCFRLFPQSPHSFSWWDYRFNAFQKNRGVRIDHILASPALASRCRSCRIDSVPRGWERPSDHAPVLADFKTEEGKLPQ